MECAQWCPVVLTFSSAVKQWLSVAAACLNLRTHLKQEEERNECGSRPSVPTAGAVCRPQIILRFISYGKFYRYPNVPHPRQPTRCSVVSCMWPLTSVPPPQLPRGGPKPRPPRTVVAIAPVLAAPSRARHWLQPSPCPESIMVGATQTHVAINNFTRTPTCSSSE